MELSSHLLSTSTTSVKTRIKLNGYIAPLRCFSKINKIILLTNYLENIHIDFVLPCTRMFYSIFEFLNRLTKLTFAWLIDILISLAIWETLTSDFGRYYKCLNFYSTLDIELELDFRIDCNVDRVSNSHGLRQQEQVEPYHHQQHHQQQYPQYSTRPHRYRSTAIPLLPTRSQLSMLTPTCTEQWRHPMTLTLYKYHPLRLLPPSSTLLYQCRSLALLPTQNWQLLKTTHQVSFSRWYSPDNRVAFICTLCVGICIMI